MPKRKRTFDAIITHVEEGRAVLHFPRDSYVMGELAQAFADGTRVTVDIRTRVKPRSLKQNAFYWGCFLQSEIDCFLEFWGERYDKKQIHDWNKQNFFGEVRPIESTGEVVRLPGSSSELSTVEFEVKMEDIRQWFQMNFEWKLPYPNEQTEIDYET